MPRVTGYQFTSNLQRGTSKMSSIGGHLLMVVANMDGWIAGTAYHCPGWRVNNWYWASAEMVRVRERERENVSRECVEIRWSQK